MSQENNSHSPYKDTNGEAHFQSTVEQSAAYQAALTREKAQEEAQAAASEAKNSQEAPASSLMGNTDAAVSVNGSGAIANGAPAFTDVNQKNETSVAGQPINDSAPVQPAQTAQAYNPYANPNNPYAKQDSGQNAWAPQQPVQANQAFNGANASNEKGQGTDFSNQNTPDFSPGSMNFMKKDDSDDMSPGLKWGSRIGWFAIGLVGGIFGIMIAWISASSLGKKYRRQAMMAAWLGLVAQAALYMFIAFSGVQVPFLPQAQTGAESSIASGTSGSTNASGANAFG